jgi:adenine phosphoribosyltransferase
MDNLKKLIREVPDFPKPGINFYDITTLLQDPEGLESTIDAMTEQCRGMEIDTVIGIESRGFIFAAPISNTDRTLWKCTRTPSAKATRC